MPDLTELVPRYTNFAGPLFIVVDHAVQAHLNECYDLVASAGRPMTTDERESYESVRRSMWAIVRPNEQKPSHFMTGHLKLLEAVRYAKSRYSSADASVYKISASDSSVWAFSMPAMLDTFGIPSPNHEGCIRSDFLILDKVSAGACEKVGKTSKTIQINTTANLLANDSDDDIDIDTPSEGSTQDLHEWEILEPGGCDADRS